MDKPTPKVVVVFFCHDGGGKALLNKRSQMCRDEKGRWDCGGGIVEFGESLEEALKREIKEEYGADVIESTPLGFREVRDPDNDGTPRHYLAFDFFVRLNPEHVKNMEPHKMEEIGWFALDQFPEPLHSQFPKFFAQHKEKLKNLMK